MQNIINYFRYGYETTDSGVIYRDLLISECQGLYSIDFSRLSISPNNLQYIGDITEDMISMFLIGTNFESRASLILNLSDLMMIYFRKLDSFSQIKHYPAIGDMMSILYGYGYKKQVDELSNLINT